MPWQTVARSEELPEGVMREAFAGEPLLLVRVDGVVRAASAVCPHKFGLMAEGELQGALLTCPVHTATFDLATGRPQPGQEWAGVLPVFACREQDGVVHVLLPD
jgi:nitrite reductase/ring-hydroxylating ferredoxin subunit